MNISPLSYCERSISAPLPPCGADHPGKRRRRSERGGDVIDIGPVEQHRRAVGKSGHAAHAGERGELRAKTRLVGARSGLAHIAGREHHQPRIERDQRGEAEAEPLHHARPHVLDDEIAPLRQAPRERHTLRLLQIDGDAVFRIVEERKAAAAVEPGTIVLERRILHAKTVGPIIRLHVHDAWRRSWPASCRYADRRHSRRTRAP